METIIDFQLKDFFNIRDERTVHDLIWVLELLRPLKFINNPKFRWWNRHPKMLPVKPIMSLTFGEVGLIRANFNDGSVAAVLEAVSIVTGLSEKDLMKVRISQFYGVVSAMKEELIEMHENEKMQFEDDDDADEFSREVNAKERLERFGVLNIIDALALGDIRLWEDIEQLPYRICLSKLLFEKEKNAIQNEITRLQRKKLNLK